MSALLYDIAMAPLQAMGLKKLRANLVSRARGKVLEVGVGTGLNLPHYSPQTEITAIEPDDAKRARALRRLSRAGAGKLVSIQPGDAQALAFGDGSFDAVVATLVFCTIPDPGLALKEIRRVLKKGGTFFLLEHVRPPGRRAGRLADALTPVWSCLVEGCHLNRDPESELNALGFEIIERKILWRGIGKLWVALRP